MEPVYRLSDSVERALWRAASTAIQERTLQRPIDSSTRKRSVIKWLRYCSSAAPSAPPQCIFSIRIVVRAAALLRDQAVKATTNVRDVMGAGVRDLANRGSAIPGRVRSLFRRRKGTDDVLVERVRSKMGRYVGHPGAIEVTASGGHVTLSGSVLAHEHDELLEAVRGVAGVTDIVDHLAVHKTAGGISELQGGRRRRGELPELMQENWSPGIRIVAGTAGTTLALLALRGGVPGLLLGAAGALILLRSTMRPSTIQFRRPTNET
jgi:hypothetical protein